MDDGKQTDYFLKIDGVDGESKDSKHTNEIQLQDFKFSVVTRGRQGDYKVGRPFFDDARFFAYVERSYPKLKELCANGSPVPKAILTCRKAGKTQLDYLRITLSNLFVTSCKLASPDAALPMMEFTISFARQEIEYKPQQQDGTLGGGITAMADLGGKRSG